MGPSPWAHGTARGTGPVSADRTDTGRIVPTEAWYKSNRTDKSLIGPLYGRESRYRPNGAADKADRTEKVNDQQHAGKNRHTVNGGMAVRYYTVIPPDGPLNPMGPLGPQWAQ